MCCMFDNKLSDDRAMNVEVEESIFPSKNQYNIMF